MPFRSVYPSFLCDYSILKIGANGTRIVSNSASPLCTSFGSPKQTSFGAY